MTLPLITTLYAGIFGIMLAALGAMVGVKRGKLGVALYDGGHHDLAVAIRRHGNFTEYVPQTLLVIALLEITGAPSLAIHGLAGLLLVCRLIHAFGLNYENPAAPGRAIGAIANTGVLVVASGWAIYQFVTLAP